MKLNIRSVMNLMNAIHIIFITTFKYYLMSLLTNINTGVQELYESGTTFSLKNNNIMSFMSMTLNG